MTENKQFYWIKKHYATLENLSYVGMVFWFVPAVFGISYFQNAPFLATICIILFIISFVSAGVFFDDDRLWRWIND